ISPLGVVLFPIIGEKFDQKKENGIAVIQKIIPIILVITFLIGVGILIFGGIAITLFYGSDFYKAIGSFRLLSFVPMVVALNMLLGIQTMVNLKMDKKFFIITLCAACLSFVFNFIFISFWSASGAAVSWFLTELFCTITMYIVLLKNDIQLLKYEYFKLSTMLTYSTAVKLKIKNNIKKGLT